MHLVSLYGDSLPILLERKELPVPTERFPTERSKKIANLEWIDCTQSLAINLTEDLLRLLQLGGLERNELYNIISRLSDAIIFVLEEVSERKDLP
jgi:hypothetical protein